MFPGGTAAEILIGHHNVAGLHFFHKLFVNILHAVFCQLLGIRDGQIPGGDDDIRVYIVSIFKNASFCLHWVSPIFSSAFALPAPLP